MMDVARFCSHGRRPRALCGGLPIRQFHKVEDYVTEPLAEFHFSFQRFSIFTRLSPLQFGTRERVARAPTMRAIIRNAAKHPSKFKDRSPGSHLAKTSAMMRAPSPKELAGGWQLSPRS